MREFGEMVEWSITPVLKTGVLRGTGGSNPSLSAHTKEKGSSIGLPFFCILVKGVCFLSDAFGLFVRNVRTHSPPRTDTESDYCGRSEIN